LLGGTNVKKIDKIKTDNFRSVLKWFLTIPELAVVGAYPALLILLNQYFTIDYIFVSVG
jgi:hypothetical protein